MRRHASGIGFLLLACSILSWSATLAQRSANQGYLVTRIFDARTFEIAGVGRVRLLGVAPPQYQPNAEQTWQEAGEFCQASLIGKKVRLETDLQKINNEGQALVYLYLEDGTFFNLELVRAGYANVSSNALIHLRKLKAAEEDARRNNRGIWNDGQAANPAPKAASNGTAPVSAAPAPSSTLQASTGAPSSASPVPEAPKQVANAPVTVVPPSPIPQEPVKQPVAQPAKSSSVPDPAPSPASTSGRAPAPVTPRNAASVQSGARNSPPVRGKKELLKAIQVPKGDIVSLRLPAAWVNFEGNMASGIPIYGATITWTESGTLVDNMIGWRKTGFPMMHQFSVAKLKLINDDRDVEIELRSTAATVKLRFGADADKINNAWKEIAIPPVEWSAYADEIYAEEAETKLRGEMALWPKEKQVSLIRFLHQTLFCQSVTLENYKEIEYLTVDTGNGGWIYNDLQLNQTQRLAKVINERLLVLLRQFSTYASEMGNSGVQLTGQILHKSLLDKYALPMTDHFRIYITADQIKKFVDADITSQQLIDQGIVLLNNNRVSVPLSL